MLYYIMGVCNIVSIPNQQVALRFLLYTLRFFHARIFAFRPVAARHLARCHFMYIAVKCEKHRIIIVSFAFLLFFVFSIWSICVNFFYRVFVTSILCSFVCSFNERIHDSPEPERPGQLFMNEYANLRKKGRGSHTTFLFFCICSFAVSFGITIIVIIINVMIMIIVVVYLNYYYYIEFVSAVQFCVEKLYLMQSLIL